MAVELKVTLSVVNSSVLPSDLIKVYLSTSNGKNVSLVPAVGLEEVVICLSVISTLKVFLIVIEALVKSTSDTLGLGSTVYKVLSEDLPKSLLSNFRSVTCNWAEGRAPSTIPVTVVTPTTSIRLDGISVPFPT